MDDLVEMIDDLLGTSDDDGGSLWAATDTDDDGGSLWAATDTDGDGDGGSLWAATDDGGSSSGEWYGTESAYEATSRVLAEQHATNLEVIDNIDGVDDYEYEVVTY